MSFADLVRKLTDAGATPEVIAIAVEAVENTKKTEEERKAKHAAYRRQRRQSQRDVNGQSMDSQWTVNDTSMDNDSKKEKSPHTPLKEKTLSQKENPPKGGQKKKGSRISENWIASPEDQAFAQSQGMTAQEIDNEAAKFRDYWTARSGEGSAKLDWSATWRNWIRRCKERSQYSERKHPLAAAFDEINERIGASDNPFEAVETRSDGDRTLSIGGTGGGGREPGKPGNVRSSLVDGPPFGQHVPGKGFRGPEDVRGGASGAVLDLPSGDWAHRQRSG